MKADYPIYGELKRSAISLIHIHIPNFDINEGHHNKAEVSFAVCINRHYNVLRRTSMTPIRANQSHSATTKHPCIWPTPCSVSEATNTRVLDCGLGTIYTDYRAIHIPLTGSERQSVCLKRPNFSTRIFFFFFYRACTLKSH